jgi:carbonic anhydrase
VPAEIVFDQGLGDLFVIRVAGNIVAPSQVGSVEFAAERYHTRLVVVLGHSQCGAVLATLEELSRPTEDQSRNLRSIVGRIRPTLEGLLATDVATNEDALIHGERLLSAHQLGRRAEEHHSGAAGSGEILQHLHRCGIEAVYRYDVARKCLAGRWIFQ